MQTHDKNKIDILNQLYLNLLNRPVDENGIKNYSPYIHKPNGISRITTDIMRSKEYKNKQQINNFDSLAGDRTSYINNEYQDISSSPYAKIIHNLISKIVLIDNSNYTPTALQNRIKTVEQSLCHIARTGLSVTIFPHKEKYFNTEHFIESLKDINNLKYWIYYLCIINMWKHIYKKIVATCGTAITVNKIIKLQNLEFHTVFNSLQDYILDYLSIKMIGRLLDLNEKKQCIQFILKDQSAEMINFIQSLGQSNYDNEIANANETIKKLTKQLGHRPKLLVMIAYLETQNQYFIRRMLDNVNKLQENNPLIDIEYALDNERISKEPTDYTPWSRVKRIRNLMIEKYPIHNYDYLYIIDSDIIDYPLNFPTRAIGLNPKGITAPMALIENSVVFYDWCGYQKLGATSIHSEYSKFILDKGCKHRNFMLTPPYVNDTSRLVEIDCVGCTYIVPTSVFSQTYGDLQNELIEVFTLAKVNNHKIEKNIVQYEDHPTFTDHYTVCAAIRANGGKIYMDRGSAAYHADLPIHGEAWH